MSSKLNSSFLEGFQMPLPSPHQAHQIFFLKISLKSCSTWESLGSLLGVSWESLRSLLWVSQESHGSLLGVSWEFLGSFRIRQVYISWSTSCVDVVSQQSLSTLSLILCSQLPHSLHYTQSILHQTSGAQNTSSCFSGRLSLDHTISITTAHITTATYIIIPHTYTTPFSS